MQNSFYPYHIASLHKNKLWLPMYVVSLSLNGGMHKMGFYSLSGKTSRRQNSEAAEYDFTASQSLWYVYR